jgi:hypothetical protein
MHHPVWAFPQKGESAGPIGELTYWRIGGLANWRILSTTSTTINYGLTDSHLSIRQSEYSPISLSSLQMMKVIVPGTDSLHLCI